MAGLAFDVRFAWRTLARRPGFTALAVLTMALGIGANTVAFSAINALVLRPFNMPDSDRLGWIMLSGPGNPRGALSHDALRALSQSPAAFEAVIAERRVPVSLRTPAGGEQAWSLLVTANYLHVLGERPERGRLFTEGDLAQSEVPAVVSHRFWTTRMGAPESLAGHSVVVNGRSFPVVGVLRDDFQGIGGLYAPDMWLPLERMEVLGLPETYRQGEVLTAFGKLRPGVTKLQAQAELDAIAGQLSESATEDTRRTGHFHPVNEGHPEVRSIGKAAWLGLGAVGIVLVIACFNLATLLMARTSERHREMGVRSAVGASRWRLVRQLVVEGLMLAAFGAIAALVVAAWSSDLLATFSIPAPIPQRLHLGIDRAFILFTAGVTIVAGILPAILPALQATRRDLLRSIRMSSGLGARSKTRSAFVIAQVAGSTLFVVAALLFARSFLRHTTTPTGFDDAHVIALQLSPSLYGYDAARSRTLIETLETRIESLPSAMHVSVANRAPFYVGFPRQQPVSTGGTCAGQDCRQAVEYAVTAEYFDALGIQLKAGRDFNRGELQTGAAVIVNEHLATLLWPDGHALGRTLRIGADGRQVEVVGVAPEYTHRSPGEPKMPYVYRPLREAEYAEGVTILVRAQYDPAPLLAAVREQVRAIDPDLPSAAIATMADRMKVPQWMPRTTAGFFVICAALSVLLASIGLFGVMYFTVGQRTREFGIRIAVGATSRRVMAAVLGEGLGHAVPGVLLGIAGGYVLARVLSGALFGVTPADPMSLGATAALQVVVALAACAVPAWRATRTDPMVALRND